MAGWIKTLTVSMCILTILIHLIPDGKFVKYVKFYAGLLFFLLASEPLLGLLGKSGELERLLQLEFLKEEYYDMETAVAGMADLKEEEIKVQYQQEILRQIGEVSLTYGLEVQSVDAEFGSEDGYGLTKISVLSRGDGADAAAAEAVRSELAEVYAIAKERIQITYQEDMP